MAVAQAIKRCFSDPRRVLVFISTVLCGVVPRLVMGPIKRCGSQTSDGFLLVPQPSQGERPSTMLAANYLDDHLLTGLRQAALFSQEIPVALQHEDVGIHCCLIWDAWA